MAEYIEREALKKQMNATCRNCDARFDERECGRCGMEWARKIVRSAPAADVVEVVRCKDCKYWDGLHSCDCHKADENGTPIFMRESDFCSYGERNG